MQHKGKSTFLWCFNLQKSILFKTIKGFHGRTWYSYLLENRNPMIELPPCESVCQLFNSDVTLHEYQSLVDNSQSI